MNEFCVYVIPFFVLLFCTHNFQTTGSVHFEYEVDY
jgi:hypothetical protein